MSTQSVLMGHWGNSRKIFQALGLVTLCTVFVSFSHADDTEKQTIEKLDYAALVEALVSPNTPAITINRSGGSVKFPANYDMDAQKRVLEARRTLHENIDDSMPFLVAALDNKQYCMTINWADGDGFYNKSVGDICRNVIESHLEVYREKIRFSGPRHWHKYTYRITPEWWQARRDKKLFELQLEAIEWATRQFEKDGDSDPRFDRKQQLADLRALRETIAKECKPANPRPMHRMATRDVGLVGDDNP